MKTFLSIIVFYLCLYSSNTAIAEIEQTSHLLSQKQQQSKIESLGNLFNFWKKRYLTNVVCEKVKNSKSCNKIKQCTYVKSKKKCFQNSSLKCSDLSSSKECKLKKKSCIWDKICIDLVCAELTSLSSCIKFKSTCFWKDDGDGACVDKSSLSCSDFTTKKSCSKFIKNGKNSCYWDQTSNNCLSLEDLTCENIFQQKICKNRKNCYWSFPGKSCIEKTKVKCKDIKGLKECKKSKRIEKNLDCKWAKEKGECISNNKTEAPTAPTKSPTKSPSTISSTIEPTMSDNQVFSCPYENGAFEITEFVEKNPAVGIKLNLSLDKQVCFLILIKTEDIDDSDDIKINELFIGRSYEGNTWEKPNTHQNLLNFDFNCSDDNICFLDENDMNSLCSGGGGNDISKCRFILRSYKLSNEQDNSLNDRLAKSSRFLMQATFGATMETIESFDSTNNGILDWIDSQIQIPYSSHREYYRARVNNPKFFNSLDQDPLSSVGRKSNVCFQYSRWSNSVFNSLDIGQNLTLEYNDNELKYNTILINGVIRSQILVENITNNWNLPSTLPYTICGLRGISVGSSIKLYDYTKNQCNNRYTITNPPLKFYNDDIMLPSHMHLISEKNVDFVDLNPPTNYAKLLKNVPLNCEETVKKYDNTSDEIIFLAKKNNDDYYIFDPHLVTIDNTLEAPAPPSAVSGNLCHNVPRTTFNIDKCVVTTQNCEPVRYISTMFFLNDKNLKLFYELSKIYVYEIKGLRMDGIDVPSPCDPRHRTSRWKKVGSKGCSNQNKENYKIKNPNIEKLFIDLLKNSKDLNPNLRDISTPIGGCSIKNSDEDFEIIKGITLDIDNQACYKNVHPDLHNIYDFSHWTLPNTHPGNKVASDFGKHNPIKKPAEKQSSTILTYPSWHPMSNWKIMKKKFTKLGRVNDEIDFATLPASVQSVEMAKYLGAYNDNGDNNDTVNSNKLSFSCGSPGEIKSDPALGARYHMYEYEVGYKNLGNPNYPGTYDTKYMHTMASKSSIWAGVILSSQDQLRQRMAWSLSQIFVISNPGLTNSLASGTELFVNYYDILVRNAFGNYRDILKEVSFSPVMGSMLTFVGSKSLDISKTYPDENYARELMQLFTIGLYELNIDGTRKRNMNENNTEIETYTNDDIKAFARAWTGFKLQAPRGNIEVNYRNSMTRRNFIDPMDIIPRYRDKYPKMGLKGVYIGDKYPLCGDIPKKAFLRKGAKYHFLGTSSLPEFQEDPILPAVNRTMIHISKETNNKFYKFLCHGTTTPSSNIMNNPCSFSTRPVATLDQTLICQDILCEVDTIRVIGLVQDNNMIVYFEYIHLPCVNHVFFNNGKSIGFIKDTKDKITDGITCVDPQSNQALAIESCCQVNDDKNLIINSKYDGERTTYETNYKRCNEKGLVQCQKPKKISHFNGGNWSSRVAFWSNNDCQVKVKINADGQVAIHHSSQDYRYPLKGLDLFQSKNYFRVNWVNGSFPSTTSNKDKEENLEDCNKYPNCKSFNDNKNCHCEINVENRAVFKQIPSKSIELFEKLHIGSVAVDIYDADQYSIIDNDKINDVISYKHKEGIPYDKQTIFRVFSEKKKSYVYLKNIESIVRIAGNNSHEDFIFRNPPTFINFVESTKRDVLYETEEVINHLFYHENTPTFVAYQMLQRFTNSNPSPRYISEVANAFAKGSYHGIGKGAYGDMAATVSAILLDREARSTTLTALDPTFGKLREPLLKLFHYLRSMEFKPKGGLNAREIEFKNLESKIGQNVYEAESIFSFFQQDFAPMALENFGLFSPESNMLTGPSVIGLLNGLMTLTKQGLDSCDNNFGKIWYNENTIHSCSRIRRGLDDPNFTNQGKLNFSPIKNNANISSKMIIRQLDILLTGGRLSNFTTHTLLEEYNRIISSSQDDDGFIIGNGTKEEIGLKVIQQLLLTTSEFHTTASSVTNLSNSIHHHSNHEPNSNNHENDSNSVNNKFDKTENNNNEEIEEYNQNDYKAIIHFDMSGGADTFHMLVPHSDCTNTESGKDLFVEYQEVRGNLALEKESLHTIDANNIIQPCKKFGLHESMPNLTQSYNEKDVLFFANIGNLVEMINDNIDYKTKQKPKGLFAHNIQQKTVKTLNPGDASLNVGVLGRITDYFAQKIKKNTASYSLSGFNNIQASKYTNIDYISKENGITTFDKYPTTTRILPAISNISSLNHENFFGQSWSSSFTNILGKNKMLDDALQEMEPLETIFPSTSIGKQLKKVAELIKIKSITKSTRDTFYVKQGGFDTHGEMINTLQALFNEQDNALAAFKTELISQKMWDKVLIVVTSEFGRTLAGNGIGSDHGYSQNSYIFGGGVKGGKILGEFPKNLTDFSSLSLGRGRLIPTTPFQGIWDAIANWFGIPYKHLTSIIPNRANFPSNKLFKKNDLFH